MGRLIASAADVRTYTGDESASPTERELRSAAFLVLRATRGAVYTVGGDGKAVDGSVEQALVSATCEVWLARQEAGVSSDVSLADLGLQSASLGSASYSLVPATSGARGMYRRLPFDAVVILESAGLVGAAPQVVG